MNSNLIKNEWKYFKLSEIFNKFDERVNKRKIKEFSCTNDGIALRELKFKKKLSKSIEKNKIAKKGDFVFGLSRKILNFGLMYYDEGCFSQAYKVYKINGDFLYSRFLEKYIRLNHDYFYQCIKGGAREGQGINEKILMSLKVPKPEKKDLVFINLILDFLESLENRSKKNNDLLKKLGEVYFNKSFPQNIDHNSSNNKKLIKFEDIATPKKGKVITKATASPGKYPVVAGGISPAYYHNKSNTDSPVITISASGNAGFVNLYLEDIWASDCSYINKSTTEYLFYSYYFLKNQQEVIFNIQHGGVQKHINPNDIKKLLIIDYPKDKIENFEKFTKQIFYYISKNYEFIKKISDIRNFITKKIIFGKHKYE